MPVKTPARAARPSGPLARFEAPGTGRRAHDSPGNRHRHDRTGRP